MAVQVNLQGQVANAQQHNAPVQGWSTEAIYNTILKTATLTAAALLYMGNQNAAPNSFFDRALACIQSNQSTVVKAILGLAFAPEAYKVAKFATYDHPAIGASIAGAAAGLLMQKHCNLC